MTDVKHIMLGAGGHARVLQETLELIGIRLHGFVSPSSDSRLVDVDWLGADDALAGLDPATTLLVNGIGSTASLELRRAVYERAVAAGHRFATVMDPTAIVRPSAVLGDGAQVLAGAIVNSGASVGADTIVNSGAIVEHDSSVGAHSHLCPGVVLAGDVSVGDETHVGLGVRVIQGISVGSYCVIGAGAVVTKPIIDGSLAVGVPAESRARE